MKLIPVALMFCASAAFAAPISVTLENGAGKVIGTAKIRAEKKGVVVHLTVEGLSPGVHAVHFHEKAVCTGPDFKSAGGHFNPEGKEHGLENPKGHHAGDMPNFTVGEDGKADLDLKDESVTLGKEASSLFHTGGTSLVIHAKPDDNKSQPAGNAGDRVACGEIHAH